jgi:hypothetical protein
MGDPSPDFDRRDPRVPEEPASDRHRDAVPGLDATRSPRSPRPATVRIAGRGREPVVLTVLILVFVVGAVWKPWAPPARGRPLVQGPLAAPSADRTSPSPDPLRDLRAECEVPGGWRVYSREGFLTRTVRVWRSVEPIAHATGPLDPAVPLVQVGPVNEALGYCAPWSGAERPPPDSIVTAWRLIAAPSKRDGTAPAGAIASRVRLARIAPTRGSELGALYAGPGDRPGPLDGAPRGWAVGRYVFSIAADGWERWWAVEVSSPGPHEREPSAAP